MNAKVSKENWKKEYTSLKFFSRKAIFFFSLFCTPVWGAVLFGDNLLRTGRKQEGFKVISIAVLYTASFYLPFRLFIPLLHPVVYVLVALVVCFIGASILAGVTWRYYIGEDTVYSPKTLKGPFTVIFFMLLASSFVVLILVLDAFMPPVEAAPIIPE